MPGGSWLGAWGAAAFSRKVSIMESAWLPPSWLAMVATAAASRRPSLPSGRKRPKLASSTTASACSSTAGASRWGPSEWATTTFSPPPASQLTARGVWPA